MIVLAVLSPLMFSLILLGRLIIVHASACISDIPDSLIEMRTYVCHVFVGGGIFDNQKGVSVSYSEPGDVRLLCVKLFVKMRMKSSTVICCSTQTIT